MRGARLDGITHPLEEVQAGAGDLEARKEDFGKESELMDGEESVPIREYIMVRAVEWTKLVAKEER